MRFICVQLAVWAAVAWVLYPLRGASVLPNPPFPAYTPEPPEQQEMLVLGPTVLSPGTRAAMRVVVYDPRSGQPIVGARLRVVLVPRGVAERVPPLEGAEGEIPDEPGLGVEARTAQVFAGRTDAQGTANVQFSVPEDAAGEWALAIDVAGQIGIQRLVLPVTVRRQVVGDLTTDQLTYMPGEAMHPRVQTLDAATGLPVAGQAITLTVIDSRGNRICTEEVTTSAYGLAPGLCELASRVNEGEYRVTASLGDTTVERAVMVQARPDAAFALQVSSAEPQGVYGEPLTVTVQAFRWWGEPVVDAQVEVTGSLDGVIPEINWRAEGKTDEGGRFAFDLGVFHQAGVDLSQLSDPATVHLVARVASGNEPAASSDCWLPVSRQAIRISVAPESGAIKPGIDNVIEVRTEYADGRPAEADLVLDLPAGRRMEMRSDAQGQARFWYRSTDQGEALTFGEPFTLAVTARDVEGRRGAAERMLPVEGGEYHLLLRPDQATYRVGEQMQLEAWVSRARSTPYTPRAVYLDVVRGGQTVSAQAAPLVEGYTALGLDLTDELSGWIEVHAYAILPDGALVGDTRRVWVEPASNLQVTVRGDREWYAQGATARITFAVTDSQGRGRQSAISGFVAEERPNVRWACPTTPDRPSSVSGGAQWVELTGPGYASAPAPMGGDAPVRAERASKPRPMPEETRQRLDAVEAVRASRRRAFSGLAERMAWALLAMPTLMCVLALVVVWRGRAFGSGLRDLAKGLFLGVVVLVVSVGTSVLLIYLGSSLFGPGALVVLGLGWVGGLLAWLVFGWGTHDGCALALWALVIGYLAVGAGLRYAVAEGADLAFPFTRAVLSAFVGGALAIYVSGTVQDQRHKRGGRWAAMALVLLLSVTAAGALAAGKPNAAEEASVGDAQLTQEPDGTHQGLTVTVAAPTRQPTYLATPVLAYAALLPPVLPYEAPKGSVRVVEAVTDLRGQLFAEVPLAGQSGTWDLTAGAVSDAGEIGRGGTRLQVRQPLSIDVEMPSPLTVGDQLDLPVVLRNALPISQTVQFTVTPNLWFKVRSKAMGVQRVEVPGNRSVTRYVPVQVIESGSQMLDLVAESEQGTDAKSYPVDVVPDGLLTEWMYGGRVGDGKTLEQLKFRVPWSAIRGTDHLTVGLYSGWSGLLTAGLDGALRRSGYGEPSAGSRSLPEVGAAAMACVLREAYLERDGSSTVEQREASRRALAQVYQQLLTFESAENGFSALGAGPADLYQTAYALMRLSGVARVYPVDPSVIERTAHWLLDRQSAQGTWIANRLPPTWSDLPRPELPATAYAAWALIEAGYARAPEVRRAVEHLERYLDKAQDPYTLALAVHAVAAFAAQVEQPYNPALEAAVARLAEMAEVKAGLAVWRSARETFSGAVSVGEQVSSADTERTALAVLALLRTHTWVELAGQGLNWLAENRDSWGTWRSPQATLLALEALSAAVEGGYAIPGGLAEPVIRVVVGEGITQSVHLGSQGAQVLVFDQLAKGYNDIEMEADGPGLAVYQALGTYYLPWDQVTPRPPEGEAIQVEVAYSRTSISVGETITVGIGVRVNRPGVVPLTVVELGLPPGLELVTGDWDSLVASGVVAAYERVPGQVRAYLSDLSEQHTVHFEARLRARFPLVAKTQLTRAYDLANPRPVSIRQPVEITVIGPGS